VHPQTHRVWGEEPDPNGDDGKPPPLLSRLRGRGYRSGNLLSSLSFSLLPLRGCSGDDE